MDISTPATGQTLDANISRIRVYSRSTMPTRKYRIWQESITKFYSGQPGSKQECQP
jgi:hypothetical protein